MCTGVSDQQRLVFVRPLLFRGVHLCEKKKDKRVYCVCDQQRPVFVHPMFLRDSTCVIKKNVRVDGEVGENIDFYIGCSVLNVMRKRAYVRREISREL